MCNKLEQVFSQLANAEISNKDNVYTIVVAKENLRQAAETLRNNDIVRFDFLRDIIGMDYTDSLGVIYNLSPSEDQSVIVLLESRTDDRENPAFDTVEDLWLSAPFYEREVHDFFGIRFLGNPDMRRIFLRQDWRGYPLRKDYDSSPIINPIPLENEDLDSLEYLPVLDLKDIDKERKSVFDKGDFVVNFGPQHPATHGVLHLRVSLDGEVIKKVDPNFGYIHRGIEKICEVSMYHQILHLADRLDYLSGSINRHAVCMAIEKGIQLEVPPRAQYVRTIIDELTRIASHLLGWGAMAMDMGAITAFVYGMRDREKIMKIFEKTCGGRLMANYSMIGGLMEDIHPDFQKDIKEFVVYMRKMLREHHILFTGNPIARGRMEGVGHLTREQAISIGATGPVGRASGWQCDVRKIEPYAAYDKAEFTAVLREGGMTFDRYYIRLDEIEESLKIIEQLVDNIPEGPFCAKPKPIVKLPEGEYTQRVENARGDFSVYINSRGDKFPYRVKFRSPSLVLVNVLKHIAPGNKIADLIMLGGSLDYVIPCIDR